MNIFLLSQQSELLFSPNVNLLFIYYKKNVNNQKLFFLHMFVGLGTTAIKQLKIEKRMMRVFISSGKTYTFLGNVA